MYEVIFDVPFFKYDDRLGVTIKVFEYGVSLDEVRFTAIIFEMICIFVTIVTADTVLLTVYIIFRFFSSVIGRSGRWIINSLSRVLYEVISLVDEVL